MKTQGKNNGCFSYELDDEWERAMVSLIHLSLKSGVSRVELDYLVVKDYCSKYELDSIDTLLILNSIVRAVY